MPKPQIVDVGDGDWVRWPRVPRVVGWYNATAVCDQDVLRWWNGEHWSMPAWPDYTSERAAEVAKRANIHFHTHAIQWRPLRKELRR